MIYLDYNATTPIDPGVYEAMKPFLTEWFGNPSSGHWQGRHSREALDTARGHVAALLNASPDEIVFTSGGTESINAAIKGVADSLGDKGRHVVTSVVEHAATLNSLSYLERRGFSYTAVGVDATGMIDPDSVRKAIRSDTILVSIMLAQNEVGTLMPVAEIGRIAREAGVLFHVDAAQAVGKVPIDVRRIGADLLSLAGHKFYAPKGVGALFIRDGVKIEPLIHGVAQEGGRRGGTENLTLAVGLGAAARIAADHLHDDTVRNLRDCFWQRLQETIGDRVTLNGHPTQRLPNTLNVSFAGYTCFDLLARLPDLAASAGAACHARDPEPSKVLTAMGLPRERALGAIRFSVGRPTTQEEIDRAVEMIRDVAL